MPSLPSLSTPPHTTPGSSNPTADTAALDYQRARLANEMSLSVHEEIPINCMCRLAKHALLGLGVLVIAMVLAAVTLSMLKKSLVRESVAGGGVAVVLFFTGVWFLSRGIQEYTDRITSLVVSHTGLRWTRGDKAGSALWQEITDVDVNFDRKHTYQTGLVGAMQAWAATNTLINVRIKLASGEALIVPAETVTDFVRFVNTVRTRHAETQREIHPASLGNAFKGLSVR